PAHAPDLHSFPTRRSSDLLTLRASHTSDDVLQYEFSSTPTKENGPPPKYTITNTVSNYRETPSRFELEPDEKMWIAATVRKGNADRKSTRLNSSHVSISYA